MMHLENPESVEIVQKLCEKTNWRALDTDTGMFIDQRMKNSNNQKGDAGKSWWKLWGK
jgi:hypothetical protein